MASPPDWLTAMPRPALMAIGDSFLNGMRSYTINDALARLSIPALVAGALAPAAGFAPFQSAQYPAHILLDAEEELRRVTLMPGEAGLLQLLGLLPAIKRRVALNARDWLRRFATDSAPGTPRCFDNLAIAGAVVEDVFDATLGQVEDRIAVMTQEITLDDDVLAWQGDFPAGDPCATPDGRWGIGDVHIALNARHLMNPANAPGLRDLRVVDIVRARRPRTLLVNLGPNHGLLDITLRGDAVKGLAGLDRFATLWPRCAAELAALPDVEVVVVLLLPLPSLVPNMMPLNRSHEGVLEEAPPPGARYFPLYVSALDLPLSDRGYNAARMAELDARVESVRARMRAATEAAFVGSGKTLRFVDLAALIAAHDYKHRRGPPYRITDATGTRDYSNYAMGDKGAFAGTRLRGGVCSLDNHHPSTLGYRYVAEAVRQALPEGFAPQPVPITDRGDTVLRNPPWRAIGMLDALHRRPPEYGCEGFEPGVAAIPAPERLELDHLLLRAGWLR